ncbi:MAG TPA: TRAP transporter substrate-binding protein [Sphingomicrobium sp.]|nr:TRAP transporter substrate-binding protein [Sphingomicrobium sp.]
MKRRQFLQAAGVGVAATAIAKPAIAQSMPEVRWRLSSTFPKSLDTLYGAAENLSKYVSDATDGKFQIQPFAAGEIVGTFQAFDAVSNGTVEMIQGPGYYYYGKDPTFAVFADIPFGLNARQKNAWLYHGGGQELVNEFLAKYNVYTVPGGNTGTQMGGWFRKEIKTVEDLKGLKFRIGGFGGPVMVKLGVVPQMIAGGDVYISLEKGTIDGAEWIGPYDDEKLGFNKIARVYHYPAWWEGSAQLSMLCNLDAFNKLPKTYQAIFEAACYEAHVWMTAKYDAQNPAALRRLVVAGAQLRPFPRAVMETAYKASHELYAELSAKNPRFKKVYDPWVQFRDAQVLWWRVAEHNFESFMIAATSNRPEPR